MDKPRFGQRLLDMRKPSNMEVLFEFLEVFDEVPMPDGITYRLKDGRLQYKSFDGTWYPTDRSVNSVIELVKDVTPEYWQDLRTKCVKNNVYEFKT